MLSDDVNKILKYAKSLIGIPYTWWLEGENTCSTLHPFYINKIPTLKYLKEYGINCTGLINLLRLKMGKDVKGVGKYKGGTYQWYKYFKDNNFLKEFKYNKKYPLGTLFIRKYRNIKDQGHVAVLYKWNEKKELKDETLHAYIIHAISNEEYPINNGKVFVTNLGYTHFSTSYGYFDNIVLPEDWLR